MNSKTTISQKIILLAQLFRVPMILIIAGTQLLLRFCIIQPFLYDRQPGAISALPDFLILVLVTVFLAVGGYIINDYFDAKIDAVNRPSKVALNKVISPRGAIKVHMTLHAIAVILGFYLSWRIQALTFGFIFLLISTLLWIYSAKYKRVFLWGNLIVAILPVFIVLIVWLFEFFWLRLHADVFAAVVSDLSWVTRLFLVYAFFGFLIALIMDIIKDLEESEGDQLFDCRTLPVVAGLKTTKIVLAGMILLTAVFLAYVQVIMERIGFGMVMWYLLVAVQIPILYLFIRMFKATTKADFHHLETLCKLIMVAGILSMEIIFIS
ncbi:MAG: geranylgeranylglycerol-phosphate geranylgeranyltransferase [Bacteroidales bacterium]|nr:geranylgeranylglycerol-phosphate geranylgeranyltransferase [Bacteroidales bacterium]HNW74724.1 geranylgeranylglycerol-phosphate geranylgeranyltransferase [Bacteroidales bacterium]HPS50388.1 geranylgeranylglycerol-phosphate geranylgeranyltransferase [Bacteroidales bacterium]